MRRPTLSVLAVGAISLLAPLSCAAQSPKGDASRGGSLFNELRCSTCHSVKGVGGKSAPVLGAQAGQPYTSNTMASSMWSHVTRMWDAMDKAGISRPRITEQQAADLFAYFGGSGADNPGDAEQGRKVFEAKLCASCHDDGYQAPPLDRLAGKVSPFSMVQSLWEHGGGMLSRMVSKNVGWQTLTPDELGHVVAYLNAKK